MTNATDTFYVETAFDQNGEPLGEFRLVKNGCTYAYAKARSTLCALRDLLNAPRALEGQTVEWRNGLRGVVQCVLFDSSSQNHRAVAVVRNEHNMLDTWDINGLKVVTLDQAPSTASEASP